MNNRNLKFVECQICKFLTELEYPEISKETIYKFLNRFFLFIFFVDFLTSLELQRNLNNVFSIIYKYRKNSLIIKKNGAKNR